MPSSRKVIPGQAVWRALPPLPTEKSTALEKRLATAWAARQTNWGNLLMCPVPKAPSTLASGSIPSRRRTSAFEYGQRGKFDPTGKWMHAAWGLQVWTWLIHRSLETKMRAARRVSAQNCGHYQKRIAVNFHGQAGT